jgi:hypothetical protein
MRLPNINKGAVEPLRTPDIKAPLHEANMRTAMFNAIGIPLQEASNRYVERENERQFQEATLLVNEADDNFVAQYGGKDQYDPMEVDDGHFNSLLGEIGIDNMDQTVPKHRIYAEWRSRKYEESIDNASSRISDRQLREKFVTAYSLKKSAIYADESIRASKEQIMYNAKQSMIALDRALLKKNYDGATGIVDTSGLPDDVKQKAYDTIAETRQKNYFKESIELGYADNADIEKLKRDRQLLLDNNEAMTSNIPTEDQVALVSGLSSAIHTIESAKEAGRQSQIKILKEDARTMVDDIWKKKPIDIEYYNIAKNAITDKDPVLAREMEWAIKHQPVVAQIMLQTPTDQRKSLDQLKAASTGSAEASYLIDKLEKSYEEGISLRGTDTMKFGREVGLVNNSPIDYSSPEAMVDSLKKRVTDAKTLQTKYGTFTGFLEVDELVEFGNRIENSPDQLQFFMSINKALGEDAESFYEQLKKYDIAGTGAVAGQIASQGSNYIPLASQILKGSRLLKEDKMTQLLFKENKSLIDSYVIQKMGSMYAGNPTQQTKTIDAFYAALAASGDMSNDSMDRVFQNLTGGAIEYNGYTIQSPVPGMSGWTYKKFMRDIKPSYWETPEMRMYGYTPEQARQMFLDGELTQVGIGKRMSLLKDKNGAYVKKPDGVTPFVFTFDPNASTNSQDWRDEEKEEQKREEENKVEAIKRGETGADFEFQQRLNQLLKPIW